MREDFLWLQVRISNRRMRIMWLHSICPSHALQFFLLQMSICGFWHPTKGPPLSISTGVPPSHGCSRFFSPACCRMVSCSSWSKQTTVSGASIKCVSTGSIFSQWKAILPGRQKSVTAFKPWDVILGTGFSCSTMEETVDIWNICHFCSECEGCNTKFYHFQIFCNDAVANWNMFYIKCFGLFSWREVRIYRCNYKIMQSPCAHTAGLGGRPAANPQKSPSKELHVPQAIAQGKT